MPGKGKPQVKAPLIPGDLIPGDLTEGGLEGGRLEDYERYSHIALAKADFSGQAANFVSIESSRLSGVSLCDTELEGFKLTDVALENCDLANGDWYKAAMKRVELVGCRIVGLKASEGQFGDVLFRECKGRMGLFRFAGFKAVRFENCDLSEADFGGADLSGVVFSHCDLTNCDMNKARLVGADFRGSNVNGMKVGIEELRGAIVGPEQAVSFLRLLGLVIEHSDEDRGMRDE